MNLATLTNPIKITVDVHQLGVLSYDLQDYIRKYHWWTDGPTAFDVSILIGVVQKMESKRQTKLLKGENKKFNFSLAYHQAYLLRKVISHPKPVTASNEYYTNNVIRMTVEQLNKQLI